MDEALHPDLRALLDRIVPAMRPEEVWLFGSRARGDHRPDSDWDLLVVLPDGTAGLRQAAEAGHEAKAGLGLAADIVPTTRSAFLRSRGELGTPSYWASTHGRRVYAG